MSRTSLIALMVAWIPSAQAAFPDKPITMIVAFGAGGATDVTARTLSPYIEEKLGGARIIVSNRPGAVGEIGFAALAHAAPDGYTIGFVNPPAIQSLPIERPTRFALSDFDLLANVVDDPSVLTVRADSPFQTLRDVIDAARTRRGTISMGTTGVGSDEHLAMLTLDRKAGTGFIHVPFTGGADAHRALLGGHIQVCGQNLSEAMRGLEGGDPIRVLGVMSEARVPAKPDLPTFREQGYDITMTAMRGIAAPQGLPPEIRARLATAIAAAIADPGFQAKAAATQQPLRYLDSGAFRTETDALNATLRALWAESPWR